MYRAFDDQGIMMRGSKRACLDAIADWADGEEIEERLYSDNELTEIWRYFSREHENEEIIEFSGFTVEKELK